MFGKQVQFDGAGGRLLPAAALDAGNFYKRRLIGSSIAADSAGTVVQMGYTAADPLLDASTAVGSGSPALTVELPKNADAAKYQMGGVFFIYNSSAALTEDSEADAFVPFGFMVQARVIVPDGGLEAGRPLVVNFTSGEEGTLTVAVTDGGTAGLVQKTVAYTAVAVPDGTGGSATEELVWIYWTGC